MFDFIQEHNLFSAVQDQVLLLVEFDQEQMEIAEKSEVEAHNEPQDLSRSLVLNEDKAQTWHGRAIALLVDHTYSIPVCISIIPGVKRILIR